MKVDLGNDFCMLRLSASGKTYKLFIILWPFAVRLPLFVRQIKQGGLFAESKVCRTPCNRINKWIQLAETHQRLKPRAVVSRIAKEVLQAAQKALMLKPPFAIQNVLRSELC